MSASSSAKLSPEETRPNPEAARPSSFAAVPGWMVSGMLHAGIIVFLVTSGLPSCGDGQIGTGANEGEFREVGIYVKQPPSESVEKPEETEVETPEDNAAAENSTANQQTAKAVDQSVSELIELPNVKTPAVIGSSRGGPSETGPPEQSEAMVTPNAVRPPPSKGQGPGSVSFMGQTTQAQSVVFVIDTSSSMGGYHALSYAQAKLKSSINGLSQKQKFQIIAYNNQAPRVMRLGNDTSGSALYPALGPNRRMATAYINTFVPSGGTKHFPALVAAFKFRPDVIFFLTDAEDALTVKEMNEIRMVHNKDKKTHIHCIKFGQGADLPSRAGDFLKSLASENKGSYTYIDVEKLAGP